MQFTIEEIEKLTDEILNGSKEEIPPIELADIRDFLKFFTAMGVYIIAISRLIETVNKRLENIELALMDEKGIGKA
jgi:hypothetical protein